MQKLINVLFAQLLKGKAVPDFSEGNGRCGAMRTGGIFEPSKRRLVRALFYNAIIKRMRAMEEQKHVQTWRKYLPAQGRPI